MSSIGKLLPVIDSVVHHIDEGVIFTDQSGTLLYHNPAALELLGLHRGQAPQNIKNLGTLNLQKALLKAAIDAGEVDAAGRPSGNFVRFEHTVTGADTDTTRYLEFNSGLVTLPDAGEKLRLIVLRDRTEHRRLEAVLSGGSRGIISKDPMMLEILARIEQVAPTNAFVLLQGESGTGKTQLARQIHQMSSRAGQPFIEVNCAAIPESLIESELFGHIRGAFTGAVHDRPGRFQAADQGTLFLDEISELPLNLQAKLLKVLQDQQFEMVGSDKSIQVDVRLITASNTNLRDAVDDGRFRADLYYRLAVIPLNVPPLRDRPGDIPLLIKHFCEQLSVRGYPSDTQCNHQAMKMMMDYPWPGNVRELANAVEHGIVCAENGVVTPQSLPQDIRSYCRTSSDIPPPSSEEQEQRGAIEQALKRANGSRAVAATLLGIDRTTLWRRMQKLGIK
ncbi:MAG: sigma-54 interaction domain-containing protein [Pseudomonadota bacterium]